MIDRITATGADDSTNPNFLAATSKRFPLVEWGILVSQKSFGIPRFPSKNWLQELYRVDTANFGNMHFSCHLCGKWTRELCFEGNTDFQKELSIKIFGRIQLNFHAIVHKINRNKFIDALKTFPTVQFIFQLDDVNNGILDVAKEAGIDCAPLFDTFGGAGVLPESWPKAAGYAGYAGGLSPLNLDTQLPLIMRAAEGKDIWIDAETHLRSGNDKVFEEAKVTAFLEKAYASGYCRI